ncbi:unnamed protein product, partial [Effrenium voratum]
HALYLEEWQARLFAIVGPDHAPAASLAGEAGCKDARGSSSAVTPTKTPLTPAKRPADVLASGSDPSIPETPAKRPAASPVTSTEKQKMKLASPVTSTEKQKMKLIKRQEREEIASAKEKALQAGVDFHSSFQPEHNNLLPGDHWRQFLQMVAGGKCAAECEACSRLLSRVQGNASSLARSPVSSCDCSSDTSEALARKAEILAQLKTEENCRGPRGRPAKGAGLGLANDLWRWLATRRFGEYKSLGGEKLMLRCRRCNADFAAQRASTIYWVLQHEASENHQCHVSEEAVLCAGVEVARGAELAGQSSPDLETAAFQLWLQHGMPLCSPGLEHECYSLAGKPMIRATACKTLLQRSRWLFHTL